MGRSTVLVTGCFDLLTPSHLRLLAWAARLGEVVVGIDHEDTIRSLGKGPERPILSTQERMDALMALPHVSNVVAFRGPGAARAIASQRPRLWVKGGDYDFERLRDDEKKAAQEVGAGICIAPRFDGPTTTEIIQRIRTTGCGTNRDAERKPTPQ